MIDLATPGRWTRRWALANPFTNVYGFSRSLLAGGTACILAFNRPNVLFTPVSGVMAVPRCDGVSSASLFCLVPSPRLEIVRWLSVLVLLVIASGWRPRLTALPHAWLSFSFFSSCTIFDGGDQVTLVLSLLLLPIALLDNRRWHWSSAPPGEAQRDLPHLIAWSAILIIRIQVAGIYFVSGIAKLGQSEWADGTAMYYWLLTFGGAPHWVLFLLGKSVVVVAMTWGTIALEVALAAALVMPRRAWPPLLIAGIVFHALICLFFDLGSFAIAMIAAVILYLRPADEPFCLPRFLPGAQHAACPTPHF
jgi:antimicrobial peptide system SdpB family protein